MPFHSRNNPNKGVSTNWHANKPEGPGINDLLGGEDRQEPWHLEQDIAKALTSEEFPFNSNDEIAAYIAQQLHNTTIELSAAAILESSKLEEEDKIEVAKRLRKLLR